MLYLVPTRILCYLELHTTTQSNLQKYSSEFARVNNENVSFLSRCCFNMDPELNTKTALAKLHFQEQLDKVLFV